MKKFIGVLILIALFAVGCCSTASAQTKVSPESYMSPEQLAAYNADLKVAAVTENVKQYSKIAGVGAEVGIAVKEGLTAVVDVADKFSGTDVGKFTMILVAWKVIGKDITRITLGLIFLIVMTILFIKIYRGYMKPQKIPTKRVPFLRRFFESVEYQIIEPEDWDGRNAMPFLLIIAYMAVIGITHAVMFAG